MKKKIAVILITFCLFWVPLGADEIRLNNGALVTGNVVELGEDTLRIATVSGEIFIPRNKVDSAFLGWETLSSHPKEGKAIETSVKNPPSSPDLGALGGDFLEE